MIETIQIEKETFQLIASVNNRKVVVDIVPEKDKFIPFCEVVKTSWSYGPVKFIDSIRAKHGQSFEGEVGFAFFNDFPDELQPGITFFYLDQETTVKESFFCSFLQNYVNFFLEMKNMHKLQDPEDQFLRSKTRELN